MQISKNVNNDVSMNPPISYGGGLDTSPFIMRLTTQGPYIQKEHSKLYKILKVRVKLGQY